MTNTWFISDTHFGHYGTAVKFVRPDGTPLRPFSSVEEQDEKMIDNWNRTVAPGDRVYHLGDFCMARRHLFAIMPRLYGRIAMVLGNHDPWDLDTWKKVPNVTHLLGSKVFPADGFVCTHIPVSSRQLESRFKANVHGHMHANTMDDPRYINVSVEQINYTPVSFDVIRDKVKKLLNE